MSTPPPPGYTLVDDDDLIPFKFIYIRLSSTGNWKETIYTGESENDHGNKRIMLDIDNLGRSYHLPNDVKLYTKGERLYGKSNGGKHKSRSIRKSKSRKNRRKSNRRR
jgi:hypothetical protein